MPILVLYGKECDTQKCDAPNEVLENNHEKDMREKMLHPPLGPVLQHHKTIVPLILTLSNLQIPKTS